MPTGNISHFSKPEEFDNVDQILKGASATDVFWVPGEHDAPNDDGKSYLERYRNNGKGAGWCSFDKKGVHFVGLVNGMNLNAGGLGTLGHEQLQRIEDDVKHNWRRRSGFVRARATRSWCIGLVQMLMEDLNCTECYELPYYFC